MKIKILAMSDTHIGDPASLLTYDGERRALFRAIREFTEGTDDYPAEVDTVVLLGDICEKCLAREEKSQVETTAFMKMLLKSVRITGKIVYLFGNHDHTLWRDLVNQENKKYDITPLGAPILLDPKAGPVKSRLARIFFNYPDGSLCRAPSGNIDDASLPVKFYIGNFFYKTSVGERFYLFTHGQHWRKDVTSDSFMKLFEYVDRPFIGHDIKAPNNPYSAKDLLNLEKRTYRFLDSMWSNDGNEDMSRKAFSWFILSNLASIFEVRKGVERHTFFCNVDDKLVPEPESSRRVRNFHEDGDYDGPTKRFLRYREVFRNTPDFKDLANRPLTFVYGDTHDGGYDLVPHILDPKKEMRLYNTGAWISHSGRHHPPGYLFAIKEGGEWLVEVAHDGKALESAAHDSEHLRKTLDKWQWHFLKLLQKLK